MCGVVSRELVTSDGKKVRVERGGQRPSSSDELQETSFDSKEVARGVGREELSISSWELTFKGGSQVCLDYDGGKQKKMCT